MISLLTRRLLLRNFRADDWPALQQLILQYEATRNSVYDHEWPTAAAELKRLTEWFSGQNGYLAVCLRESGELIGLLTFNPDESDSVAGFNMGFIFDRRIHGRGYATEACEALLEHAFSGRGVRRVVAGTALVNWPAIRLLERLGFKKTGESPHSFRTRPDGTPIMFTGLTYVLTENEWPKDGDGPQ